MKTKILVTILTVLCLSVKAQTKSGFGVELHGGTNQTGGGSVFADFSPNQNYGFTLGLGVDVSLKVAELGTNYSGQVVENQYPEDIVNTGYTNRLSAYVTPSYRLGRFIIGSRLGFYENQFYQNRYNNIMDVYYIITTATDKAMVGGFIEYRISKTIGISLGDDNYNAGTIGISARL